MIIKGDCIEEMKKLEENSVDAIITDPPYGLEFMGKEWDKFAPSETNKKRWDGKRKEMFERNISMPGTGFKQLPTSFGKKQNTKCKKCNHYKFSGTPCKCDNPDWEIRENKFAKGLQQFVNSWATECLRVLKPGGFLLSFGGTRTYHRLVCGIEDAGFEIRDTIMWLYGSGFPKSLNIGKAVDKLQGNDREVVGSRKAHDIRGNALMEATVPEYKKEISQINIEITKGNSEWEGWGTALKPAVEPIVVARKPLSEKNVALNVLKHGTGGLNIDECRVGTELRKNNFNDFSNQHGNKFGNNMPIAKLGDTEVQGRFPANIILDEDAGKMLDEQSGDSSSTGGQSGVKDSGLTYSMGWKEKTNTKGCGFGDKGGASRFFYCAKASKSERNYGCENFEDTTTDDGREVVSDRPHQRGASQRKNNHPTVKPIALIEYLIKLVSRKGSIVLDPFLGSGTTAIACLKLERQFIGIEKEEEYIKISQARIKPFKEQVKLT